jgi:hypothetical protein
VLLAGPGAAGPPVVAYLVALVWHSGAVVDDRLAIAAAPAAPAQVPVQILEHLHADPLDRLGPDSRTDRALDIPAIAGKRCRLDLVATEPVVDRRAQGGLGLVPRLASASASRRVRIRSASPRFVVEPVR